MPRSSLLVALGTACLQQGAAVLLHKPNAADLKASEQSFGPMGVQPARVSPGVGLDKFALEQAASHKNAFFDMGPLALASDSVAARLPGTGSSAAWGGDKLKGMTVRGIKDGTFEAGVASIVGSDGEKSHHALYGIGYKGLQGDTRGLPPTFGIMGVAKAEPDSMEIVNAVPSAKGGVDYGKFKVAVKSGHVPADQLPWANKDALRKGTEGQSMKGQEESQQAKTDQAAIQEATEEREAAAKQRAEQEEDAKKAAQEEAARKAAEQETAKKAAEQEAARQRAEQEEAARKAAEQETARKAAEEEAARKAAEQETARKAAEEEEAAARKAAEKEAARQRAEQEEAARKAAEQEAARQQAEQEEATRKAMESAAAAQAAPEKVAEAAPAPVAEQQASPTQAPFAADWLKQVGKAIQDANKAAKPQQPSQANGDDFFHKIAKAIVNKPTDEQLEKRKKFFDNLKNLGAQAKPPTAEDIEKGKDFFKKIADQMKPQSPEQIEKGKEFIKKLLEQAKPSPEQIEHGKDFFKQLAEQASKAKANAKTSPGAGKDFLKKIQEAIAAKKPQN